jgi:starch-binding outer membrane protein, SusD/RagB family
MTNMKKNSLIPGLLFAVLAMVSISCKKQLEVSPLSSIDENAALKTKAGIEGNITSIYSNLKAQILYGRDMLAVSDALADNGFATNHSGRLVPEARNTINAHFVNWSSWYYTINSINLVIDAVTNSGDIKPAPSATELARYDGQMRFLRALAYFNLVREYSYIPGAVVAAQDKGGVPLMLTGIRTSEFASSSKPARASLADVYNQIYADLNIADAKLTNSEPEFPFRGNKAAVEALYALVALYNKDYVKAKAMADLVITSHGSRLTTTATTVSAWRSSTHPESLFEVSFATAAESLGVNVSMQSCNNSWRLG